MRLALAVIFTVLLFALALLLYRKDSGGNDDQPFGF